MYKNVHEGRNHGGKAETTKARILRTASSRAETIRHRIIHSGTIEAKNIRAVTMEAARAIRSGIMEGQNNADSNHEGRNHDGITNEGA